MQLEELLSEMNKLSPRLKSLYESLKIKDSEIKLKELEEKTSDPNFWNNSENSQKIISKISSLKSKIKEYKKLKSDYDDLLTLTQMSLQENDDSSLNEIENDFKKFSKNLETMTLTTLLTGEYDSQNAILTFHAGAGGTEAQDWVEMLCRMYTKKKKKHGYKVKMLDFLDGEEAGLKSASLLIEGENTYGFLKGENGVHRLVRISPFDASGRRHTSFASISVTPVIDDKVSVEINPNDLKIDVFHSSGAGGQSVNTTDSAVRITHLPTGIVVTCQNERSQVQNKEKAMQILRSKLFEQMTEAKKNEIKELKGEQKDINFGSQIRSYVMHPYSLVKDHRTNTEETNVSKVLDGDIDKFISSNLRRNAKWYLGINHYSITML